MHRPARILIVDDEPDTLALLRDYLSQHSVDYDIRTAGNADDALAMIGETDPDLLLLDISMPGSMDGIELCQKLKTDGDVRFVPIIMVTGRGSPEDVQTGLDAGAEEYLTHPIDPLSLRAHVAAMLRIKDLHDRLAAESHELHHRVEFLKRFFSPHLLEQLIEAGPELLKSHRREISVAFCELTGFADFAGAVEPEEMMEVLKAFHGDMTRLAHAFGGMLQSPLGARLMVVFNDPLRCADHTERAVKMCAQVQERALELARRWSRRGSRLGFAAGIARGYATLGAVGSRRQLEYTAVGPTVYAAARLVDAAEKGGILITERAAEVVVSVATTTTLPDRVDGVARITAVEDARPPQGAITGRYAGLSEREVEVLRMLPGRTNNEIADALYVSESTVANHLNSVYRKIKEASGKSGRTAAVEVYREHFADE